MSTILDLGVIELAVGNNGPRASTGVYVTFEGIEDLIVGIHEASKGTFNDKIWRLNVLDAGESATISIRVLNISAGAVNVVCTIHGNAPDPDMENNVFTYHIGRTRFE